MRNGIDCNGSEWEEINLSNVKNDLTAQIFNKLTAKFPVRVKQNKRIYWLCECECGNNVACRVDVLTSGHSKSCGCWKTERLSNKKNKTRNEMIGKTFGELTVLNIDHIVTFPSGVIKDYYNCRCSCGNTHIVLESSLCNGLTKSCGCKTIEMITKSNLKDLTNMRFGKLIALRLSSKKAIGHTYWDCECDCGNFVTVRSDRLSGGKALSCGCEGRIGERNIQNILLKNNIRFKKEQTFLDLVSESGSKLRYDFGIIQNEVIIRLVEFDGSQHEEPIEYFGGLEKFLQLKANDTLKNQYALSHNIPLVRIPYSKRDSITLDDILGNQYLIKGDN